MKPEIDASFLVDDEIRFLTAALSQWGGPARCTDEVARVIGVNTAVEFGEKRQLLHDALSEGRAMSASDWRSVVVAAEIVFVSDELGAGVEWSTTTGLSDEETIHLLRSIQRKVARAFRQR
jgi:hypothetical protein